MKRFADAILVDFGTILAPKTPPEIVKKTSKKSSETHFLATWVKNLRCDGLGDAIWTVLGASGTDFGRFSNDFGTFFGRFWDVFWEVPVREL